MAEIIASKNAEDLFAYIIHTMDDDGGFLRSRFCYRDKTLPDYESGNTPRILLVALAAPFAFDRSVNYYEDESSGFTSLKMQLFYYDSSDEGVFERAAAWSAAVGFRYPIKVDLAQGSYEILPMYDFDKRKGHRIEYPKYKVGDTVHFLFDRGTILAEEHRGTVYSRCSWDF